jgi:hypothetical protein
MRQIPDARDIEIVKSRAVSYDARKGPRVGDFVYLKGEDEPRRFTHDWGDDIQTTMQGSDGSFYLAGNYCSYSGGLDRAIMKNNLVDTGETRMGWVWIFHHDQAEAHNGVDMEMPFRVYRQI